ncbi:MAG: exopolyphosphatase [Lachnospiraceae bacterium]|nr:exopolyphosphatase [Candidatus Colinaster scatohippi]
MATKLFAAIDVGSYELNLKIFEFGVNGMKIIDSVGYRLDLGSDSYSTGKIPAQKVAELIRILNEFSRIMKGYHVSDYKAYGTSAIRETTNTSILIDQIEQRTGIHIDVLSNSEQRFLDYKAIASKGKDFLTTIEKSTAIVDIGGGSIQISLFNKDKLDVTQNIKLGIIRLYERLRTIGVKPSRYEEILNEMIGSQLSVFQRLYLKNRKIDNLIIVDDYLSPITWNRTKDSDTPGFISAERFNSFFQRIKDLNPLEFSRKYSIPVENRDLVFVASALMRNIVDITGAKQIWAPGATITDGIAYEYGEKKKLITFDHDFEEDIIACARNSSRRYMGDDKRSQTLENIALTIYDGMKKCHGLGKRDRLILRLATILHDCGKYVSLYNLSECSYDIIMATEIIGLSHKEREILANVVKHNHAFLDVDADRGGIIMNDEQSYMRTAKLTAILRLANGLDKSQKQKFGDIKASLKDDRLVITVRTDKDITYEKSILKKRADFFEEIFNVKPEINHISKTKR